MDQSPDQREEIKREDISAQVGLFLDSYLRLGRIASAAARAWPGMSEEAAASRAKRLLTTKAVRRLIAHRLPQRDPQEQLRIYGVMLDVHEQMRQRYEGDPSNANARLLIWSTHDLAEAAGLMSKIHIDAKSLEQTIATTVHVEVVDRQTVQARRTDSEPTLLLDNSGTNGNGQ